MRGLFLVLFLLVSVLIYGIDFHLEVPVAYIESSEGIATNLNKNDEQFYESSRILFTGDVFLGRDVERRNIGSEEVLPFEIFSLFATSTAIVINFEGAIPQIHTPTPDFGMQFSIDQRFLPVLAKAGITHASLANNHALDHGAAGLQHTISALDSVGITPFGHPTELRTDSVRYITAPPHQIALVGLHTLFSEPSQSDIDEVFKFAAKDSDMVIVYVHWGEEYQLEHSVRQERLAQRLVTAGADLIIGHHPHVVQGIYMVDDVPVIYSLGNTIFDQYFSADVQEGLLVELVLGDESLHLFLHPISSIGTPTRPRLMDIDERDTWLTSLAERSDPALAADIQNGKISWRSDLLNQ